MKSSKARTESIIIFFDGECNLCNGFIQFMLGRDPKKKFRFAALQSEIGKKFGVENGALSFAEMKTIAVFNNGQFLYKSRAVLYIFQHMDFPWKILSVAKIFPTAFSDLIYDFVARNRYKWFGKKDQCMIPTPEIMERFLS